MYDETPNKEEIDWLEEQIDELYTYERLKDCDIDFLYNHEFRVMAESEVFKAGFPDQNSPIQGPARAFIMDNENADREPLTDAEIMRLSMIQLQAEIEIHRAFGHRKELRREHRSDLANAFADAMTAVGNAMNSLKPF